MKEEIRKILEKFDFRKGDLLVVPEGSLKEIPSEFDVCEIKYLHTPSILRVGGSIPMSVATNTTTTPKGKKGSSTLSFIPKLIEKLSAVLPQETVPSSNGGRNTSEISRIYNQGSIDRFLRHVRRSSAIGDISPKGGLTLAVELLPENKLRFSYAICSKNDLFNKRAGRRISETRLDSKDFYEISNIDTKESIVNNILAAIEIYLTSPESGDKLTSPVFTKVSARVSIEDLKKIKSLIIA